jgi:tetratricopeptide (TPR) repeat protein
VRAIGVTLDQGAFRWAVALAAASAILFSLPWMIAVRKAQVESPSPPGLLIPSAFPDSGGPPAAVPDSSPVLRQMRGESLRLPLLVLALMSGVFVPVSVMLAARLEGTGSAGVALQRDYMAALVCNLMGWSAALLPIAAVHWLVHPRASTAPPFLGASSIALLSLGALYFLALSVLVTRTVGGTGFGSAASASAGALIASAIIVGSYSFVGNVAYYLASPWVLYYLYMTFGSDVRSLGGGLSSRQRLRRLLETSTVNARDADAHYQLGLIYQHRRDFERARAHFEKAVEIDPKEPDAQYQLGRILRSQGNPSGAIEHLEAAAAIDDKHSSSEVWREIGAASLDLEENQHARQVLRVYAARRPFDPEGLYWYGLALTRTGEDAQAKEAFKSPIEAVRTAPSHRRRRIRQWERLALRELKTRR